MKHVLRTLGLLMLTASTAPLCALGETDAALGGVVRDVHGIPQMGALVELLGPDASVVGRAFTDDHGRYLLPSILPGNYQLRASAAFLVPVVRGNLRLRSGAHTVADLTMTAIFEMGAWLPTERRRMSEPADDWQWTLRSTANRPLLRLADEEAQVSSSASGGRSEAPSRARSEGQVTLLGGDGQFGQGGAHQVITMDRMDADGAVQVMRANVGAGSAPGSTTSFALSGGLERRSPIGGETRMFASVAYQPEIEAAGQSGLEVLRSATTERIVLGDSFVVDAGTLLTAERLIGSRFDSAPYVKIAFHPSAELTLEYRLATDRALQRTEDLDEASLQDEILSDGQGRPLSRKGLHQEIVATDAQDKHVLSVAVFHDALPAEGVQGGGKIGANSLVGLPVVTDPTTGTLRLAFAGFSDDGARFAWTETISPALSACVEADLGKALEADGSPLQLESLSTAVHARMAAALTASAQVKTRRTGSTLNVSYRWQPGGTLTQVDEYDAVPGEAYLGVAFKQRIWSGRRLKGLNAVVEATNLLAQGYEPLLGPDGQTLFLAQVPRGLLGGLAFSF